VIFASRMEYGAAAGLFTDRMVGKSFTLFAPNVRAEKNQAAN
jgi:hypothetical protein